MVLSKVRRAKRVRLTCIGLSASALAAMALPVKFATPAEAKTPGKTYCYHGTCHRVKTIEETRALVGVEQSIMASHYDDCKRDRYNPCGLTSSGERFHPDRADNTASPIYPDGTMLLVWSPVNERALVVRVNNAGPYWGDRKLDLSRAAADKLGFEGRGVAKVRVRVIKAPEPAEAVYVHNRSYPPVLGDIGKYASLAQAESGMVVAMALQASAASPMAPVTTANSFAGPDDAAMLVAEAPQTLGRASRHVAALAPAHGGLKLRGLNQSYRQVASLNMGRDLNQSLWGQDVLDELASEKDNDAPAQVAALAKPESKEPKPAVKVESKQKASEVRQEKPVAREERRPKSHASNEGRSRKSRSARSRRRNAQRSRVARAQEPRIERVVHQRSAEQIMSAGIRAQSSSTM